jgi:molybdopterin synthase catalytic subunit
MIDVLVTEADFEIDRLVDSVRARAPGAGGIVSFLGVVRADTAAPGGDGDAVAELWLEHYPGMTERSIEAFLDEAMRRWPLLAVSVVHRVGSLVAGDRIVGVVVASRHRAAAFDACRFVMDYLKTDAVFWKRERDASGRVRWIEPTDDDRRRVAGWRADGTSGA